MEDSRRFPATLASLSPLRICIRMPSTMFMVPGERKFWSQNLHGLPPPTPRLQSLHWSKALTMARWSLPSAPSPKAPLALSAFERLWESTGTTHGDLYAEKHAEVSTESRQLKISPYSRSFPSCGGSGRPARCLPSTVSLSPSARAPMVRRISRACLVACGAGGSIARDKKALTVLPSCSAATPPWMGRLPLLSITLICRQTSSSGVLFSSGTWNSSRLLDLPWE
mmetsp:Transcript_10597/g.36622  ORF Transcript_10597/g.36622 Transcript_10597/m.36622 type:complete len:225 (-) Transcript_10597:2488-3162(-)